MISIFSLPQRILLIVFENFVITTYQLVCSCQQVSQWPIINHSYSLAKDILKVYVKLTQREITIDHIVKVVCEYYDIELDTFNSTKRTRDVAQARQVAMFLAKQHTKSPLTVIGSSIGGRNHATVLHSCKAVADMMDTDKTFKAQIEEIEKIVLNKN